MSQAKRVQTAEQPAYGGELYNACSSKWLEVMDRLGQTTALSPLEALERADSIHRLLAANPLDLFAAHRFLLTLLYWKAADCGGVAAVRMKLLAGQMPKELISSLQSEGAKFDLFDSEQPFLQDPTVRDAKVLSPAYLFAEMASGTNVALFDHGDDATCRLCLRCATQGLARIVPWTQSGGSGKQPAIHGAPPIMALAVGQSLCETLGLNLVEIDCPLGTPQWSGHFQPAIENKHVSLMEALTWNPRRVHLLDPQAPSRCSRCGESNLPTIGPIVYEKNEACKVSGTYKESWRDPAAFYRLKDLKCVTATSEFDAAMEQDVRRLFGRQYGKKVVEAPQSIVRQSNPEHADWLIVFPCTDSKAKSFDQRLVVFDTWPAEPPSSQSEWPKMPLFVGDFPSHKSAQDPRISRGAVAFVRAATALDDASWAMIAAAADQPMGTSVAAFDVFTSIYWPLRNRISAMPSRQAAWLTLKLMATVPSTRHSIAMVRQTFHPWKELPRHQRSYRRHNGTIGAYPLRIPTDRALELGLRDIIRGDRSGNPVDWAGLCQFIHDTLP
jgi:hypothetical protein